MARLINQDYDGAGNIIAVTIEDDGYILKFDMVRHGRWKHGLQCPFCNQIDITKPNYCPNCGAKMDGGEDNRDVDN